MSRAPRIVIPGEPHHITQRGNRRGDLFFSTSDRERFVEWLGVASLKYGLSILAHCLMTNHIHLEAIPAEKESLHLTLKSVFTKYALRLNSQHDWTGYVVQNRYFSSPLDEKHASICIRYIEENPVRAKIVATKEQYRWSSAYYRARSIQDPLIDQSNSWYQRLVLSPSNTPDAVLSSELVQRLHCAHARNLPIGDEEFIRRLECDSGRVLRVRGPGRPRRKG